MISLSLVMMLLLAVLSSLVFAARQSMSSANYVMMNGAARRMLEQVGRDVRQFTALTSMTQAGFSGELPSAGGVGSDNITYAYDQALKALTRKVNDEEPKTIVNDVLAIQFRYYDGNSSPLAAGALRKEAKQIQLILHTQRKVITITNNQYIVSAQFTMRAKKTTS